MAKRNNFKSKRKNAKNKNKTNQSENVEAKNIEEYMDRVKDTKKCLKAKVYLDSFQNDKNSWKFNKMIQVFILNYICCKEIFGKEYFNIFKSYIKKMSEKTKKEFIDKCTKSVQLYQEGNLSIIPNSELKFKDNEKKNKIMETFHKRCVDIIENNE